MKRENIYVILVVVAMAATALVLNSCGLIVD